MKNENFSVKNKVKNKKKRFSPRLRHGIGAALMILTVISLAVLIVYTADHVESSMALDTDLSFNGATIQSALTESILRDLDRDVQIWLIVSGTSDYDAYYGQSDAIEGLLKRYTTLTPHIRYQRTALVSNPTLATRYMDSLGETPVSEDCVLIYCMDTGRARVVEGSDFYTTTLDANYNYTYRIQYEKVLTEAICSVTGDDLPVLQILSGHGELAEKDLAAMTNALKDANWDIRTVSLRKDSLDPDQMLFILSPQYDLTDEELLLLEEFASMGGNFFIGCDYTDPLDLPNFNTLLLAYGVKPLKGIVIADQTAPAYSYYQERYYLMPYLMQTEVTAPLLAANENIYLAAGARAFQQAALLNGTVSVEPVLRTDLAYIRDTTDGIDSIEKQPNELSGCFDIALLSTRITSTGDRSHAFITGNTSMFTSEWVQKQTSSVPLLRNIVKYLQGSSSIDLEIPSIPLTRDGIRLQDLTVPVILTASLPLLVLAIAFFILIPRKRH